MYQCIIGGFLYAMVATRPDHCFDKPVQVARGYAGSGLYETDLSRVSWWQQKKVRRVRNYWL
jgi:hypothetical protein